MTTKLTKMLVAAVLISAVAIGGAAFALKRGLQHAQESRTSTYVFEVTADSLSEELAIKYAHKALADCEGLPPMQPNEDDRATAPDRFLVRNTRDPQQGHLLFQSKDSATVRYVHMSLADEKLTCVVARPK
jgi:hypothetical protein